MAYFLLPRRALFGLGFDADFFGVDTIGPGECAGLQHELYSRKLPEVIKSSGIILAELKSVKCRTVKTNPSLRLPIFSPPLREMFLRSRCLQQNGHEVCNRRWRGL